MMTDAVVSLKMTRAQQGAASAALDMRVYAMVVELRYDHASDFPSIRFFTPL